MSCSGVLAVSERLLSKNHNHPVCSEKQDDEGGKKDDNNKQLLNVAAARDEMRDLTVTPKKYHAPIEGAFHI